MRPDVCDCGIVFWLALPLGLVCRSSNFGVRRAIDAAGGAAAPIAGRPAMSGAIHEKRKERTLIRLRSSGSLPWLPFLIGPAGAAIVMLGDQAGGRLWAWRDLSFVGWPLRALPALAIIAVAFPPVQAWLRRLLCLVLRRPAWLLLLTGGVLFWVLGARVRRGDGLHKPALLSSHARQIDLRTWGQSFRRQRMAPAIPARADRAGWGRPWPLQGTPEVCDARS